MKGQLLVGLVLVAWVLSGCGDASDSQSSTNTQTNPRRVHWESVPSEFNPEVKDTTFETNGINTIKLNIFGFKDDVEVVYTSDLAENTGMMRLFSVYKDSASWGGLTVKASGSTLDISKYGTYQCSIKVSNGQVTAVKGGCYVRLQVFLRPGTEIEVYNVGSLISRRFIPVDPESFIKNVDDASFDKDKFAAIDDFIGSYRDLGKTPTLLTRHLSVVIDEMSGRDNTLEALRRLHSYVTDRENLPAMIESEINYFDREEARRIVGL